MLNIDLGKYLHGQTIEIALNQNDLFLKLFKISSSSNLPRCLHKRRHHLHLHMSRVHPRRDWSHRCGQYTLCGLWWARAQLSEKKNKINKVIYGFGFIYEIRKHVLLIRTIICTWGLCGDLVNYVKSARKFQVEPIQGITKTGAVTRARIHKLQVREKTILQ